MLTTEWPEHSKKKYAQRFKTFLIFLGYNGVLSDDIIDLLRASYYRPQERDISDDYKKAIPSLTINGWGGKTAAGVIISRATRSAQSSNICRRWSRMRRTCAIKEPDGLAISVIAWVPKSQALLSL